MKNEVVNRYLRYGILLLVGIFIGWLLFGLKEENIPAEQEETAGKPQIWTCSMHPQIKQDHPGKCPICGMDLIPLKTEDTPGEAVDPETVHLSKEAVALANIRTTIVSRSNPVKEVLLYGTIQPNERFSHSQVSHLNGRIEKLYVNSTGETIRQGQVIAGIYSPDLLNAQQELLEAKKLQSSQPALLEAAREKLRLWKLTDRQIDAIEQAGSPSPLVEIVATTSGIVTAKKVEQGDYVSTGSVLFDLTDLSSVWAVFDAYETDLPYLRLGDKLVYTLQALPGKTYSGKISFIDPVLDRTSRTAKVRVETPNPGLHLKPEMYADAMVKASLQQQAGKSIVIPKTAVLWTGKRSIVYVKQPHSDNPVFKLREIELGSSLGNAYVVLSGISEGDEIVTAGAFTIDASAQLEGKRSMMNTNEAQLVTGNKEHGTIVIQGLCPMCKERIEKAAGGVPGVSFATWDIETKELHLMYNSEETTPDEVAKIVARAGHDTDKYRADSKVYETLPDCCRYRKS
ncbi:MAG: efflux RND transporter periplasmic adaptor subunit [Candidatus Symbiothrix sp.]|jgi:Cu(I)/Ag(I) efflux system membrane fusion protein|nr:efflux RND transporter periplasmic adaptor subunit [Candidatus Symbiothrix sp.]